jgi:hypothetical protein
MYENAFMVEKDETRTIRKAAENEIEELRVRIKRLPEITIEPSPPE